MIMYGGVDLSTVDPNPTVYNYGETAPADTFSQIANTAGQWGATIASVVTGNPVSTVIGPGGPQTIGAAGSQVYSPAGTRLTGSISPSLLLLIAVGIAIYLIARK
jgi:hypothetical protein